MLKIILVMLFAVAVILVGLAGASRWLTGRAEAAYPPSGQIISAAGRQVHVIRQQPKAAGQQPPLVFIHGAFGQAEDFRLSLMPQTAERHDSIAIDRPGHGYSARGEAAATPAQQAAILRAGLQALALQHKPILIGFSYGGAVALAWALAYPDEVAGILLINPASHPWPTPIDTSYRLAGLPVLGPLMLHSIVSPLGHLVMQKSAAGVFEPAAVPAAFGGVPLPLTVRPATYAANAEDIRSLKPFLAEQALHYSKLKPPLLILVSDRDNSTSPQIHAHALARQVPNATLIEVKGGGHPLHFSRPAEVLAAIAQLSEQAAR